MSKDLATLEIQESLLAAKEYGQKQLNEFLTESSLHTGNKSLLYDILFAGVPCPPIIASGDLGNHATFMIDGQALVVGIGKPPKALTFGDLADAFVKSVLSAGKKYCCVHIFFDRYYAVLIKILVNGVQNTTNLCGA